MSGEPGAYERQQDNYVRLISVCFISDLKSAQQRNSVRSACSAHVLATVFRRPFRRFRCREKYYDRVNSKSIKNAFCRFLMSCCGEFQGQRCPFGVAVSIMTDSATKSHKMIFRCGLSPAASILSALPLQLYAGFAPRAVAKYIMTETF